MEAAFSLVAKRIVVILLPKIASAASQNSAGWNWSQLAWLQTHNRRLGIVVVRASSDIWGLAVRVRLSVIDYKNAGDNRCHDSKPVFSLERM
jgi:hypothetical protein